MNSGHRMCELASFVPYLLAKGEPPGKILQRVGLPAHLLFDPDAWIPRNLFLALINAMSSATGDSHCGIHIGEMEPVSQFDAFGETILHAPTLRTAIDVICRRTTLIQTNTEILLSENRRTARLSYALLGRTGEDPAQYIQGVLVFFQNVLALTGEAAVIEVSFDHVPCQKSQELERVFGPRLSFRAAGNAVVFDRGLLDLPLQASRAARQTVHERSSEEEVVRAVLTLMSAQLPYETPTLESTANTLGFHARTLERRLSRWGVSFESLLDQFRQSRSLQLMHQGTYNLTDIAFLVGYSESAHFTRAFRRWTGSPPRDYVRGLRLSHEFDIAKPHEAILSIMPLPLTGENAVKR
jgi:AraC-like DNA-binding protein